MYIILFYYYRCVYNISLDPLYAKNTYGLTNRICITEKSEESSLMIGEISRCIDVAGISDNLYLYKYIFVHYITLIIEFMLSK